MLGTYSTYRCSQACQIVNITCGVTPTIMSNNEVFTLKTSAIYKIDSGSGAAYYDKNIAN